MRILQLIPSLGSGGAERLVVDLCNELTVQGDEVFLCIIQNPNESDYGFYLQELSDKVRFFSLNQRKGFSFKNIVALNKIIKEIKPDIVHVHLSTLLYTYFLSIFHLKIRFYNTIHTLAEKTCSNLLFKTLNYICYSTGLIKAIAISEECKTSYQNFYKLKNATLIENGRKANAPSSKNKQVTYEINTLKQLDDDLVFIHVGRFDIIKNQKLLICVFNKLADEKLNYILLILGDWSFCNEAKELAGTANERIHFLGTKKNVGDYLFQSDAFCLTSSYEGMPISLLEAFSCGCTPICTPVGGIKNMIQDGITGFLSENVSESAYYDAVKRFLNNRNMIQKENLVKHFEELYSIEHCALKHRQLYQKYRIK
jgi:glycosyltransferase involved in cell wall biosynthesis